MLSQQALDDVLASQKADGRRLGTLLVERGLINETQLTQILSHQLSVPWVALAHIEFSRQLLNLVPYEVAEKYCLVPIYVRHVRGQGDTLYVALDDPSNEEPLRECMSYSGLPVRAMIAPPSDIREAIRVCYGVEPAPSPVAPPAPVPPQEQVTLAPPSPDAQPEPSPQASSAPLTTAPQPPEVIAAPIQNPSEAGSSSPTSIAPATPRSGSISSPEVQPEQGPPVSVEPATQPQRVAEPPPASLNLAPTSEARQPSQPPPSAPPPASAPNPPSSRRPRSLDEDGPTVEAVEIEIPRRKKVDPLADDDSVPPSQRPASSTRRPGKGGRMMALTLLDGTTITLGAKPSPAPEPTVGSAEPASTETSSSEPSSRGAVFAALRAFANGEDAATFLGKPARMEALFAALLMSLIKKQLITEQDILDQLKDIL